MEMNQRKTRFCKRCTDFIDRSDATKRFTILTRMGIEGEIYKNRGYLCDSCTMDLDMFMISKKGD